MHFLTAILENAPDPLAIAGGVLIVSAIGWHSFKEAWNSCAPPREEKK